MAVVVADAGPLHYLVLIGEADFLPLLSTTVLVPEIVRDELSRARTPQAVRAWIAAAPAWIRIVPSQTAMWPALWPATFAHHDDDLASARLAFWSPAIALTALRSPRAYPAPDSPGYVFGELQFGSLVPARHPHSAQSHS